MMLRRIIYTIWACGAGILVILLVQTTFRYTSAYFPALQAFQSLKSLKSLHMPKLSFLHTSIRSLSSIMTSTTTILNEGENEEDPNITPLVVEGKSKTAKITASSYIAIDLAQGKVLDEHDADRALPIASITKLVTAMVARTHMDPEQRIEISPKVMATLGSTGKFRVGEKFKLSEIMYPLLMVSSNDAAEAIAQAYGRKEFIKAMNEWTYSIGAYNTYFDDPSGLSKNNVASARDVALIMQWIAAHDPDVLDITHTKVKSVRTHTWVNPTHFLNMTTYLGGKNGFTDEAGRTGVSVFQANAAGVSGGLYGIVVLNSENRDNDVMHLLDKVTVK